MQAEVWVSFLITFKYKIIVLVHFPYLSFDCVHCSSNMNQSWANPTPSNKLTTIVYGHSLFEQKKKETTACLMLLLITMATLQKALRLKCHAVSVWRHISLNQRVKLWICTDRTTRQSQPCSSPVRLDLNKDTFCDYLVHAAATRWQCFHVLSYSPPSLVRIYNDDLTG